MGKPVIFVSTCEFSGDMHGEVLVRELRKILPDIDIYGIGGPQMAAAGVELIFDPTRVSTIGFIEALKNLRRMKQLISEVTGHWEKRRPDLMLWLDSGGFNLVLAKEAKDRQIPVICMFSPSAWAYATERAVKLADRVKLLLAVLPFEAEFYRRYGAKVTYVGHPLLDRAHNDQNPVEVRATLGVSDLQKLVVLMPGSRRQEIAKLLRVMLQAALLVGREHPVKLVLPVAASLDREWLESITSQYPVDCQLFNGQVYNLLAAADGAVIASGTATLEAAILNTPMVIVYRISRLSFTIYKMMETPEHKAKGLMIGLPNLIRGRQIVPELIQEDLTPENIARELERTLIDQAYVARVRQELAAVKQEIGPPGVMARAAGLIRDFLSDSGLNSSDRES